MFGSKDREIQALKALLGQGSVDIIEAYAEISALKAQLKGPTLRDYTVHFSDDTTITIRAERLGYLADGRAAAFVIDGVEIGCAHGWDYIDSVPAESD